MNFAGTWRLMQVRARRYGAVRLSTMNAIQPSTEATGDVGRADASLRGRARRVVQMAGVAATAGAAGAGIAEKRAKPTKRSGPAA